MKGQYSRSSVCSSARSRDGDAEDAASGTTTSAAPRTRRSCRNDAPRHGGRTADRWRSTEAGRQTAAPTTATWSSPGNSWASAAARQFPETGWPARMPVTAPVANPFEKPPRHLTRLVNPPTWSSSVTPASRIRFSIASTEPLRSMPRQASSRTVVLNPASPHPAPRRQRRSRWPGRPASPCRCRVRADSRRDRSASHGRSRRRPNSCRSPGGTPCGSPARPWSRRGPNENPHQDCPGCSDPATMSAAP